MKRFLKTGKKALSVIMAVLMVMTAWVWVAPTEAEAAAGTYNVVIKLMIADNYDMENSAATIKVSYYGNNGSDSTATTSTSSQFSITQNSLKEDNCTRTFTISNCPGYPAAILFGDAGFKSNNSVWNSHLNVEVTVNGTTVYNDKPNGGYTFNVGAGKTVGNLSLSSDSDWTNNKPYAKTITWSDTPEGMTCPKNGTVTQNVTVTAKDQYGVQMYDPTWSVKGSFCDTKGISVSTGTNNAASTSIQLTNGANDTTEADTQKGTVTATWGSVTSSKEFTITDTKYDVLFKYNIQESSIVAKEQVDTQKVFHGDKLTVPTIPVVADVYSYSDGDYDYKFLKWEPTVEETVTKDITYIADYDEENRKFIQADYSNVDDIKAKIQAEKDELTLAKFNAKYTLASLAALETAINNSLIDYPLGRTKQDIVNGYAAAIAEAYAALEPNKFDVIFLNKDGAMLLYEKNVEFETAVEAPSFGENFVETYYDSTNHYTFSDWDTDEYTSVIDDLVISPVYTAEAHNFTTIENVPSTCTQKGAKKYICDCGYSYITDESDYGDHNWNPDFEVDIHPTCTVEGQKSIHCRDCDAQKDITVIPAEGHQWGSQSVAVEAACGKIGIMTRVCDECLICEHSVIDPLEHDYKKTTVAPTCTTKGYDEHVCQRENCGHTYRDNYVEATGNHTYGEWETVSESLCEVPGVKMHICTECNFIERGTIDALKHSLPENWEVLIAATCEGQGYQTKTCSLCGVVIESEFTKALTHDFGVKTVVAPTCTTKGYTVEECKRDNCTAERIVDEKDALNHAWSTNTNAATCITGGYIEYICANDASHNYVEIINGSQAKGHNFDETIEANVTVEKATCEADGAKTVKCKDCDATTTIILPRLGHNYGEWEEVKAATNTEDGQWKRVCANNENHVEYLTIPKGDHEWDNGTVTKDASCKETGTMVYKCTAHTNCGITLEVTIPVTQHTVDQKTTAATCIATGSVVAYCSVEGCGEVFSTTEIPVVPHTLDNGTVVAATCTTSGYTTYACTTKGCSFSYNVYNENEKALGHDFSGETTVVAATCKDEGSKTVKCTRCTEAYTTSLPTVNHKYSAVGNATTATCKAPSTQNYKCDFCDSTYTEYVSATVAHAYGDWVEIQAPTTNMYGIKERTCSCGDVETVKIAPIGDHVFEEEITTPATCETKGEVKYTCSEHENCKANYTDEIPATGHTGELKYTAPTCIEEGSTKIVCSVEDCGKEIASQTIPVIAHNYDVKGNETSATCTATGTMTYTCATEGCSATKTETIPAKGHSFVTTVTDATCGEKGSVVTECTVCKDPTVKTEVELGAKGHIWNSEPEETVNATCENDGSKTYKCQNCEAENVVVIPKLGHAWSSWTVVPSTNDNEGYISRTCSNANCEIKEEKITIPAGGHNLTETARKDSSCTVPGSVTYTCTTAHSNGACGVEVTVALPLAGHTVAQREIEATCKTEGKVEAYCSVCKEVLSTETIPVAAHVYVAQQAVDATCSTSGYTPYKCACGDTYNVYDATKPATGHDYEAKVTNAPSCTETGVTVYTCKNDASHTYTDNNVAAFGHSYTKTATTAATCTKPATETYTCSACNDSYIKYISGTVAHTYGDWKEIQAPTTNMYGIKERTCSCGDVETVKIAPIGNHNFTETIIIDATCTTAGEKSFTCSAHADCEANYTETIPATGHKEELGYTAATCTEKGSTKIVCAVESCKATIGEEKEIPALGHLYGEGTVTAATCKDKGSITYNCTRTGCNDVKTVELDTNENAHQYVTTVTDSTCTVAGSVVTKCTLCNNVAFSKTLPLLAHNWDSGKETTAPTCTAEGIMTYTCNVCNDTKTEAIEAKGHTWSDWKVTPSTNSDKGSVTRTCKVEGCDASETIDIPAGGHNLVLDEKNSTKATCANTGTAVYVCDKHGNCGITVSITLEKLQHTLKTEKKDATCDTAGSVVTSCEKCDTVTITTEIPAMGHSYNKEVTAATCTSEGKVVYTCAHDANHTYKETLPMLQHTYVEDGSVEATCTSSGYTKFKCNNKDCTSNYVVITSAALGHSYSEIVSSTATCEAEGTMTLKCACGETMTTKVPALGHNFVKNESKTTKATCAAAATETYECSRCDASYTVSVGDKSAEHNWGELTVIEATNTSLGYSTKICNTCGQVWFEVAEATGEHQFTNGTVIFTKPATCKEDGYETRKCSVHSDCGLTADIILPRLAHTEAADSAVAPTCETTGLTEGSHCSVCGEVLVKQETIPSLGHLYDNGVVTKATCSADGKIVYTCTRTEDCKHTYETVIPANPDAHKLVKEEKPASCSSEGKVTITCEYCDYKEEYKTPKAEHTWNPWVVTTQPTNSTAGVMERTCSAGTCKETVEIPAGGHEFADTYSVTKAPTCKETGLAVYKCINENHENCGVEIVVVVPVAQHNVVTESTAPSCKNEGSLKTYCTKCQEVFADITIGALQHKFSVINTVEATCTSNGYKTYKCDNCDETYDEIIKQAVGHELEIVTDSSSCTDNGKVTVTCKNENCDFEQTADVPALGHDYQLASTTAATCKAPATETYKCSRCEASYTVSVGNVTENHNWSDWKTVVEATETSIGYDTRECSICNKLEIRKTDAKGEHKFENGAIVEGAEAKAATCTENGYETRACSVHTDCGKTAVIVIPMIPHTKVTLEAKAATCEETGLTAGVKCSVCDNVLVEQKLVPALGHNWVKGEIKAATCKQAGSITYNCACGESSVVEIPKSDNAHDFETKTTPATCENDGSVVTTCKLCGKTETVVIAAKGHTWNEGVIEKGNEATCTTDGKKTYTCTVADCGVKSYEIVSKLGHNYVLTKEEAATCTSSGYNVYTCENDETHTYKVYDESKPATAHNYVQVESSSTATCTQGGTVTLKCACGAEITTNVPAKGHSYGEWSTVEPTATKEGKKTRICSVCSATETVTLPMLGHEMEVDKLNSKAPSCIDEGYDLYVCKTHDACGYTYNVTLAATGHTYDAGEVSLAPTCTKPGILSRRCACGDKITEEIPVVNHNLATTVTEATCTAAGLVETKCTACDYKLPDKILEQKTHKLSISTAYPGCEKAGYVKAVCDICKDTIYTEAIAALGHCYEGDETVIKAATCTENGSKTVKCIRCDKTTTVAIPATGHNYVRGESVAATCTTSGYTVYTCACKASYNKLDSDPIGHKWNAGTVTTAATCQKDGEKIYACENEGCNETRIEAMAKYDHSWTAWTIVKEPTADEEGIKTRTCLISGCEETATIPALGYESSTYTVWFVVDGKIVATQSVKYGENATAPEISIKAPNAKYHYSYVWDKDFTNVTANLTVTAEFVPAEHSYGEWVTDKAATCMAKGEKHRVCTECAYTEVGSIEKIDHDYSVVKETVDATCTENGYVVIACKNEGCTSTSTEVISSRLNHVLTYHQAVKQTCTTDGSIAHYSCSRCGRFFEDKYARVELFSVVISKTYHTIITIEGVEATCTTDGTTDYIRCTTCGYCEESVTIPAYGHQDNNGDNYCDRCDSAYLESGVCTCNCHKVGIFNELIYKIIRFFWKLLGNNKTCACGAIHY